MAGTDGLVNHTLQGLTQGISEQTTEARRETQVEAMENCIPHVSRGVLRRNPVNFIGALKDKDNVAIATDNFYMYTYDRGTVSEQYLVLIGHRKWYIFNSNTSVLVGSYNDVVNLGTNLDYLDTGGYHPKEVFSLVTVGDYTWISNSTITTAMTAQTDGLSTTHHKATAIHIVKSTGNTVTATNPTTGLATIVGHKYEVSIKYYDDLTDPPTVVTDTASVTGNNTLINGSLIAAKITTDLNLNRFVDTTKDIIEGPFYSVTGSYPWLTPVSGVAVTGTTNKFYWNGKYLGQASTSSLQIDGLTGASYIYYIDTAKKYTNYFTTPSTALYGISRISTVDLAENPTFGLWKNVGPITYRRSLQESADFEFNDSFGSTASYGFKGIVPSSDKLPASLPTDLGDVLVKIDNSDEVEGGEYWLKWNGSTWSEDRAPGLFNIIDETTMPHTFIRSSNGAFTFGYYGDFDGAVAATGEYNRPNASKWNDRLKGDLDSAPEPGFIGKKINDMFMHNNRLGILAEDAVVLSELSEYGNFFPTTVRTIPATDPIDLIVATSDVTGLKKAVSLSGILMLFSDSAQFALTGGSGALTPESATINSVSRYNYSNTASAKVVGNKVYFITEAGNGTQQFAFSVSDIGGAGGSVVAESTSLHVPTFLPNNINYIQGHSILGYIFMLSPDTPDSIYVLNTLDIGGQTAQNAYHIWKFGRDIKGISIINNSLNILYNDSNTLSYASISLDLPADHSLVTYIDDYDGTRVDTFRSRIILSKWLIKDSNGLGTKRGRLQLRTVQFTTDRLDKYKVIVVNESIIQPLPTTEAWVLRDGVWNDAYWWSYNETDTSDTDVVWRDGIPFFERIYYNDSKVTVSSNSADTFVVFDNNDLDPSKGFALSTINYEGLFRQRSQRF